MPVTERLSLGGRRPKAGRPTYGASFALREIQNVAVYDMLHVLNERELG